MERIYSDVNFTEKLVRKLTDFYGRQFLAEIASQPFVNFCQVLLSNTCSHNCIYCFCQKEKSGRMVMCDNPNHPYGWFHFKCVGIKHAPAQCSSWFLSSDEQ